MVYSFYKMLKRFIPLLILTAISIVLLSECSDNSGSLRNNTDLIDNTKITEKSSSDKSTLNINNSKDLQGEILTKLKGTWINQNFLDISRKFASLIT